MVQKHKCPICSKETDDPKYRPFCSKRCADIDLGNWLNGSYAVPAVELDEADYEELERELTPHDDTH
jgi:hypothetical protein